MTCNKVIRTPTCILVQLLDREGKKMELWLVLGYQTLGVPVGLSSAAHLSWCGGRRWVQSVGLTVCVALLEANLIPPTAE